MADFGRETRSIRAMREIGLDLSKADRQQLTPKLTKNVEQIVSFLSPPDLPKWLRSDTRLKFWQLENYPAPDFATVRRQRDEIVDLVQNLLK